MDYNPVRLKQYLDTIAELRVEIDELDRQLEKRIAQVEKFFVEKGLDRSLVVHSFTTRAVRVGFQNIDGKWRLVYPVPGKGWTPLVECHPDLWGPVLLRVPDLIATGVDKLRRGIEERQKAVTAVDEFTTRKP